MLCTVGAWSREQFYAWTADYLRWLWHQEDDATLPRQALQALTPLLEYDAEVTTHSLLYYDGCMCSLSLDTQIFREKLTPGHAGTQFLLEIHR